MADFQVSAEDAPARAARKPWSAPKVIDSEFASHFQKLNGGVGYEYHETSPVGGGTTNVS